MASVRAAAIPHGNRFFVFLIIGFTLGVYAPASGQATPWYQSDGATDGHPEYSHPIPVMPNYGGSTPGQYTVPSEEQTRSYINSNPALRSQDPWFKDAITHSGAGSGLLNSPNLPNGASNPFYQNGVVTPNWYLPSTWSSSTMNWQGVQPNGFRSTTATTYNPSSYGSTYNPYPGSNPGNSTTYQPNYRPPYQPPVQVARPPSQPTMPKADFNANALENRNPTLSFRSNITRSVEDMERSLSMHEAAGDKVAQAIGHAGLEMLYAHGGDFAKASEQRSLADRMAREINDPELQADVLRSSAAVLESLGEFEDAIAAYQGLMQIYRSIGDEKGQAETYASVGWVNQSLGKIPQALDSYDAARYLFHKLGDKDGEVRILTGMGSLYQSMGGFEKAAEEYFKALPKASSAQYARILANVGDMALSRNNPAIALRRYESSLALIQDSGDPALEGAILAGISRCHMLLADDLRGLKSLDLLRRARAKMAAAGNRAGEAGVLATIGEVYYSVAMRFAPFEISERGFAGAVENYNKALPLMRLAGDRSGEIGVLTDLGLVFDAQGKYSKALDYYRQALDLMDQIQTAARIDDFRINIANQSEGLYQRAILLEIGLHHLENAFNLSERARARSFLDQLGNRRIDTRLPDDFLHREQEFRKQNISLQRRIEQELSKPSLDIDQDKLSALELEQSDVQRQYLEQVRELRIHNPEYASFLSISPLTLHEVQQQLPSDVTAVSYFMTSSTTVVFVVTRDSFHVSELPVDESMLGWTVSNLLDFAGENEIEASLKLLHKALIAPIKSQLRTKTVAFIPHGVLNDLPFAALTDGKHYLGDNFAVFSLPSLSALPYIHGRNKSSTGEAMVIANDWEQGLPFLQNAYGEARDVASILGAKSLLGDEATVSSFQRLAGDYEIVHLIAHIDHDKNHPEISRVILGHGNEDEGALELNQIVDLDLRKTNLVVLSGCQSQAGKRSRNDDIIGLTRAFIYAGSPSVIASLWSVDDEATRVLMVSLYTHLKQGMGKAEALRAAQIDVRQKYPNPYYWAGFVLTGDPGNTARSDEVAQTKN